MLRTDPAYRDKAAKISGLARYFGIFSKRLGSRLPFKPAYPGRVSFGLLNAARPNIDRQPKELLRLPDFRPR